MKIIFATSNPHKLAEIRDMAGDEFEILGLRDIGWNDPIAETSDTLSGNAVIKAKTISDALEVDCFSEDTGLEVDALGGRPGVHTARFAGENATAQSNMAQLLSDLEAAHDRTARFRTVIALLIDGALHQFEGIVEGEITREARGEDGFGYDPIFKPIGHERTFGEMTRQEKANFSHRARATAKLMDFLRRYIRCKNPELQSLRK